MKKNFYSIQKPFVWCMMMIFNVIACAQDGSDDSTQPVDDSPPFSAPEIAGVISTSAIQESSGLVASRENENTLWTHNDSGGIPAVYLINTSGEGAGMVYLEGAENRDWEDIAIGPGPDAGVNYIYVGEIGDNDAKYEEKRIYRFPEPTEISGQNEVDTIQDFDVIRFTYPDGKRDAETLLVDPLTKDIYVISKREASVHLYRAAYPQDTENVTELELLGNLPLGGTNMGEQIVGGDISMDGKEVLIKSYLKVFYWKRENQNTSIAELLNAPPVELPYEPEPQGESITFAIDGEGYYTLSEKSFASQQPLYFYKRK